MPATQEALRQRVVVVPVAGGVCQPAAPLKSCQSPGSLSRDARHRDRADIRTQAAGTEAVTCLYGSATVTGEIVPALDVCTADG